MHRRGIAGLMFALLLSCAPWATADRAGLEAHTKLTDGQRAAGTASDTRWVRFTRDSTQLPNANPSLSENTFWGIHADNPLESNLRWNRFNPSWNQVDKGNGVYDWNVYGYDDMIRNSRTHGMNILAPITYTPGYLLDRPDDKFSPPRHRVEGEAVTLNGSNPIPLAHRLLIEGDERYVIPRIYDPNQSAEVVGEAVGTGNGADNPEFWLAHYPVVPGSVHIYADGVEVPIVENFTLLSGTSTTPKQCKFDSNGGWIIFGKPWWGGQLGSGQRVTASYRYYTKLYDSSSVMLDKVNGTITPRTAASGNYASNEFSGSSLDSRWSWVNAPSSWSMSNGQLHITAANVSGANQFNLGQFVGQTITSGDLEVEAKLDRMLTSGNSSGAQTGVTFYSDAQNWLSFSVSGNGYYTLRQVINGTQKITQEWLYGAVAPIRLKIAKTGNTYVCQASTDGVYWKTPGNGSSIPASFIQNLNYPIKVGVSTAASSSDTANPTADFDYFHITTSAVPAGTVVRINYRYMATDELAAFVRAAVARYKDSIRYWEVWNEPDGMWVGTKEQYAEMVRVIHDAAVSVDPNAKIVAPAGASANGAYDFLRVLYACGMKDKFDIVSFHFYPEDPLEKGDQFGSAIAVVKQAMNANGDGDKPIWVSESALPTSSGTFPYWNETQQLDHTIRMLLRMRRDPSMDAYFWWMLNDVSPKGTNENSKYEHYGLRYSDNTPKPAWYAMSNITSNRGILLDLATYDPGTGNLIQGTYPVSAVRIGALNRGSINQIRVYTSRTNTTDGSIAGFAGDGYVLRKTYTNTLTGTGDIDVRLDAPVDCRFVKVEFVKAAGAADYTLDEVQVLNGSGTNLAAGKPYFVTGYADEFGLPVVGSTSPLMQLSLSTDVTTARPGDTVLFTLGYRNAGTGEARSVKLYCDVPTQMEYITGTASNGGSYDATTRRITWTLSSVVAGGSGSITYRLKLK